MNITVFYSWQSDIDNNLNRYLIQDVLEKAGKAISNNQTFSIEAVIDRDTYGIPGSPSIIESITGKIAKSDIFVCDVTIINSTASHRQTPNPNVLYELGYATAILGWERIIMVQNIAFGGVDKLPFDLRGRRILPYNFRPTDVNKISVKQTLEQDLLITFRNIFKYYDVSIPRTKEKIIWWGTWEMETKIKVVGGTLHISRVSSDAFFFSITIFDGARTGEIYGKALIVAPHSAYAKIHIEEKKFCEIHFRRRLEGNACFIEIEPSFNCSYFHGVGTSFSGLYRHITESIVNWNYLDEIDLNEIERLTGKYMSVFLNNFHLIDTSRNTFDQNYLVISGGVRGFYSEMESIVVIDEKGGVWCACLDSNTEVVRYFTNAPNDSESTPEEIKIWLGQFSSREIILNCKI